VAAPAGRAAAGLLEASEAVVRRGAAQSWGHTFTPGPAAWWVAGFVALVAVAMVALAPGRSARGGPVAGLALVAWLGVGLGLALVPPGAGRPEVEVLAVDHGLAVIIRDGAGRTLLYDCGRMGDPKVGRRVIAPALWARGLSRIDEVVLSHADADHLDGLPDLLDRFRIGAIRVAPGFVGTDSAAATAALAAARACGVPVRTAAAGEPWREDDAAPVRGDRLEIRVEHPRRGWLPGAPDNDRSLVLALDGHGHRVLLTGDLDGAGLVEWVAQPLSPIAAMLAPHHGGRSANPPWLYDRARPGLVLASQRRPVFAGPDALDAQAGRRVPVLRTWQHGAIRLRWEAAGIVATGFLDRSEVRYPAPDLPVAE